VGRGGGKGIGAGRRPTVAWPPNEGRAGRSRRTRRRRVRAAESRLAYGAPAGAVRRGRGGSAAQGASDGGVPPVRAREDPV